MAGGNIYLLEHDLELVHGPVASATFLLLILNVMCGLVAYSFSLTAECGGFPGAEVPQGSIPNQSVPETGINQPQRMSPIFFRGVLEGFESRRGFRAAALSI